MATSTDQATCDLYFSDGMARVVTWFEEEDDIMFVRSQSGAKVPVWSDRRIEVHSRYLTHSLWLKWREKEYDGDPRPPRLKEVWSYYPSVEEAMASALQEQAEWERRGECIPIFLSER